ncbi:MAG: DUF6488 family protein [Sulfurimonas sp.]|nr:DUF6488 family protein [Sulfurimonas sp.]MDQ7062400.1 DUF6488 family protein [Sulfurimonas sp.]
MALFIALTFTTLKASEGHSHSGHNHTTPKGIEEKTSNAEIRKIAKQEVERLANTKKIAASWKNAEIAKLGKAQNSFTNDWVIVFHNPKIKKTRKQNLYIFVGSYGDVAGANYTGK